MHSIMNFCALTAKHVHIQQVDWVSMARSVSIATCEQPKLSVLKRGGWARVCTKHKHKHLNVMRLNVMCLDVT